MWLDPYTTQITIICMAIVLIVGMMLGSVITAAVDRIIEDRTVNHLKKANKKLHIENAGMHRTVDYVMAHAFQTVIETADIDSDAAGEEDEE